MSTEDKAGKIFEAIPAIMAEAKSIGKNKKNAQQGYNFRGIDDVYNEMHAILSKHKVFTVPKVIADRSEERQTRGGGNLIYRILTVEYTFYAEDGSSVTATMQGEGMDSGDKASNKAMSIAQKYAMFQVFCIPTADMADPDSESHSVMPKGKTPAKPSTAKPEAVRPPAESAKGDALAASIDEIKKQIQVNLKLLHDKTREEKIALVGDTKGFSLTQWQDKLKEIKVLVPEHVPL